MTNAPYRESLPPAPNAFGDAWARLRRRRLVFRVAFAVVLLDTVPAVCVSLAPPGGWATAAALGITIGLPFVLLVLSLFPSFACPACKRPFAASVVEDLRGLNRCAHCGIAVGTPSPSSTLHAVGERGAHGERSPGASSVRWLRMLLLTLGAAYIGSELGQGTTTRAIEVAAFAGAVAVTTVVAAILRSKSFPRARLVPLAALILAPLLAIQMDRATRARRGPSDARCPSVKSER